MSDHIPDVTKMVVEAEEWVNDIADLHKQLAAVTAERDELRGQVSTLQGRIAFERRNLLEAEAERDELRAAAAALRGEEVQP